MDDTQFRLIEKLFEASEKRSEERHSDLKARLDERFDHHEQRMDAEKMNSDMRFISVEQRLSKHDEEIAAIREKTATELSDLKSANAHGKGILITVSSLATIVLTAIAGWIAGLFGN